MMVFSATFKAGQVKGDWECICNRICHYRNRTLLVSLALHRARRSVQAETMDVALGGGLGGEGREWCARV